MACSPSTHTLYFLSILPYPDANPALQPSWDEGPAIFLAEQLAVQLINNRSDVLSGYQVELIQGDGGCDVWSKAVISFVRQVLYSGKQVVGIVGPGCSYSTAAVTGLTIRENLALTNIHLAISSSQSQSAYPYSFGIIGSTDVPSLIVALMKRNNWTQIATLYDESRLFFYSTQIQLEQALSNDTQRSIGFSSAVYNTHIPLDEVEEAGIRIIVLLVDPDFLPKILCLAHSKGLVFPMYQWFIGIEQPFSSIGFRYKGRTYYCSEQELWKAAYKSVDLKLRLLPEFPTNLYSSTDVGFSLHDFSKLYQQKVVEYNYKENSSISPSYWAPFSYDAVWTLALALNNSIELLYERFNTTLCSYTYGQPDTTEVVREAFGSLDYEGLTGRIRFDPELGEVKRVVDLLQYENATSYLLIGYFSDRELVLFSSGTEYFISDSFEDSETDESTVGKLLITILLVTMSIVTAFALVSIHILSILYRNQPTVKASSLKLNHLAFIGSYLLLMAVLAFVTFHNVRTSPFSCALRHAVISTSSVGGSLVTGVVLAKTWRLYRILVHFTNPGRLISDRILLGFVTALSSVELVLSALWIGLNPFRIKENSSGEQECTVYHYFVWIGISITYNWIILLFAVWYAAQCHCVPVPRKEFKTTNIISLGYLLTGLHLTGFTVFFISLQTGQDDIAFISFGLISYLSVLAILLLLFVPPLWPVIKLRYLSRFRTK